MIELLTMLINYMCSCNPLQLLQPLQPLQLLPIPQIYILILYKIYSYKMYPKLSSYFYKN